MARFPSVNPPRDERPENEALREKLRDEYNTGLDKTGPQWERDDDEQEAAVRAAGATAYYEMGPA